jgi:uncharacterized membrane protein
MQLLSNRLPEIDALRGMAIVGMVLFHAAFDMKILGILEFEPYGWPLIILVRAVQFLFLGLVGVSIALSGRDFKGQLGRGAWIFAWGMVVTVATAMVFPQEYIRFGVLHFIGVSIPIVRLFKGRKFLAMGAAAVAFGVGKYFAHLYVDSNFLLPFGLRGDVFMLDYFPLFPWLAAPLVGLVVGEILYAKREPTRLASLAHVPGLSAVGRHSLAIYLLHQPVLYFSLWAVLALSA